MKTKFVFLMHPKEFRQKKAGTGRLIALSLVGSSLEMDIGFDDPPAVNHLIDDPLNFRCLSTLEARINFWARWRLRVWTGIPTLRPFPHSFKGCRTFRLPEPQTRPARGIGVRSTPRRGPNDFDVSP